MTKRALLNFLLIVLFKTLSIDAASMHTVIVCDTLDKEIGDSVSVDLKNMRKTLQEVSYYIDHEMNEVILEGENVLPRNLLTTLDNLQVDEEDIVVFYFSGHGFRMLEKNNNPWTSLYFSLTDEGVEFELAFQKLAHKNPKFLLMIADACNTFTPAFLAPPLVRKMLPQEQLIKRNLKKLFLQEGVVLIASSKAGEISWSTKTGGLFTRAFLHELKRQTANQETSWLSILENASLLVENKQNPDYRIYVENN